MSSLSENIKKHTEMFYNNIAPDDFRMELVLRRAYDKSSSRSLGAHLSNSNPLLLITTNCRRLWIAKGKASISAKYHQQNV
jgi:hypothetical protein